ncbi:hypothetical protein PFISCL1PPCAC_1218, partial [Pristionchus fissidentatus]
HGFISFVAMTKWYSQMFYLLTMAVYYILLLHNIEFYRRTIVPHRFKILFGNLTLGVLFASPFLYSEYYGFEVESLSWS